MIPDECPAGGEHDIIDVDAYRGQPPGCICEECGTWFEFDARAGCLVEVGA